MSCKSVLRHQRTWHNYCKLFRHSRYQMVGQGEIQNWAITWNSAKLTVVSKPLYTVWVNIEPGAKFEEVSCYFSAAVMRIFLLLLSNVYLHSQDFRCKFRMEYENPGWEFLWLWEPACLIRAQRRWQGWQTSPSRVILVALATGGYLLAPCLHFIHFSLVTQNSHSERCCCWPNMFMALNSLSNC